MGAAACSVVGVPTAQLRRVSFANRDGVSQLDRSRVAHCVRAGRGAVLTREPRDVPMINERNPSPILIPFAGADLTQSEDLCGGVGRIGTVASRRPEAADHSYNLNTDYRYCSTLDVPLE